MSFTIVSRMDKVQWRH